MQENGNKEQVVKTRLLIVDDSLVFRRFLIDIFEDIERFCIVGEAENGIEALDMVLKTQPDVILLDLEMPLMDGMTTLQHLMIHRPTPTIMFSSLSEEGTARSFDTMKYGAVDFVCKNFIFHKHKSQNHTKILVDKVVKASQIKLKAREPAYVAQSLLPGAPENEKRVVFCEECGRKVVVAISRAVPVGNVTCTHCGDIIEISSSRQFQYRRNTFTTVLGGGEGCFFNLLEIIPQLRPEMGGAVIVVIHQNVEYVNAFTEYLDSVSAMKVLRAREGSTIEGGNCYIASSQDYMSLKPYSAHLTLQKTQRQSQNGGPFDILLASVSTIFKKRAAGIVLSGDERDGDRGMSILIKNGGVATILRHEERFCQGMGLHVAVHCPLAATSNSSDKIVELIRKLHYEAKYDERGS